MGRQPRDDRIGTPGSPGTAATTRGPCPCSIDGLGRRIAARPPDVRKAIDRIRRRARGIGLPASIRCRTFAANGIAAGPETTPSY